MVTRQIPFCFMLPVFWWFPCSLLLLCWWKRGMALLLGRTAWRRATCLLGLYHVLNAFLLSGLPLLFYFVDTSKITAKTLRILSGVEFSLSGYHLPSLPPWCLPSILTAIQYGAWHPAEAHPLELVYDAYLLIFCLLSYHQRNVPKRNFEVCVCVFIYSLSQL